MCDEYAIDHVLHHVGRPPQLLLDIGVGQRPHDEANQFQLRFPNVCVVGLEPNVEVFLDRRVDFPGEIFPWGLWDHPGPQRFYPTADCGNSSILSELNPRRVQVLTSTWICCITLDQLDDITGRSNDIFLWLDIEGSELRALTGGKRVLESGRIRWIDLEVSDAPRRSGEPTELQIDELLQGHGFLKIDSYGHKGHLHNNLYSATTG